MTERTNCYVLVNFAGLEWAGVVIQRPVGHVLVHEIWQAKFADDPLRPVARRVWVGL